MEQLKGQDPTHIGPYRLIARLGAGGMGLVYLGRSDLGRTVAVKVVQAEHAQHPEFRGRFAREVAAARRVGGDWTAAVLDADTEAAVPWVATQYIPGPDLTTVVGRDFGPLPEHSVRTLANRLALALQAVHEAGLIHRDLKPSNVLVTVDGPRVIDFGIARALDSIGGDSLLTRTGMLIGSPGFMSPEQVRGQKLTPASDMFCLGAVLVYAATGRLLFGATDTGLNAHLFRIAEEEADLTGVPDSLVDLVRACLHKDPAQRPTPAQVTERTATARTEEWLPGSVLADLGRKAAELLDFVPQARAAQQAAQVQSPVPVVQPVPTSYPLAPPTPPAAVPNPYSPTAPAGLGPAPGYAPPAAGLPDPAAPPSRAGTALAMAVLAQFAVLLDASVVSFLLPDIASDLGLSDSFLRWMYAGYAMSFGALLFIGGHLADLIGRRATLLIGLTGFVVAGVVRAAAGGPASVLTAQVLQGVFAALIAPASFGLVAVHFTESRARRKAFGFYALMGVAGSVLSLSVTGPLLQYVSWRICLYATVLLALIALVGTAALVRDRSGLRAPARFDTPGALMSAVGVATLVFGFAESGASGWEAPIASVSLVCGIVLIAAFVLRQWRASSPILAPYPDRNRNSLGVSLTLFLTGLALAIVVPILGRYLLFMTGPGIGGPGAFVLTTGFFLVGSLAVAVRLLPRVAPRTLLVPGLLVAAVGVLLVQSDTEAATGVLAGLISLSLGLGIAGAVLYSTVTDGVAAHDSGGRGGLVMVGQHAGSELGFALVGGAAGQLHAGSPASLYVAAGALVTAALIGALMIKDSAGTVTHPGPWAAPAPQDTSGLLLVNGTHAERVLTSRHGMELVQEISRLLGSENVTMTRLGTELTLWHVPGTGSPNPIASRLMAEHGFQPVDGAAVVAGKTVGHSSFPLSIDAVEQIARRLEQ
ncbi:MDR family MFS transporter [Streptomyces sp. NBC_00233]|uniref:MDR family MFS transporter n=1 Tax=Streptomyces sp. NBC_00233 TaxID=2975686 RepID=UPI002B1D10EA|nr:MDR family MFS transporter [Streptomyces sp. NBC_00233]